MAKYQQVKNDYCRLVTLHDGDQPSDMTGGFVEGDYYQQLLANPTKTIAARHYEKLIEYSFSAGWEGLEKTRFNDPDVKQIYKKYGLISERK